MTNNLLYPRVLVISNNSFSKTNSNGRTLGNYFRGWPKENVAQFCLFSDGPDFEICDNYYCVSDRSALISFLSFSIPARTVFDSSNAGVPVSINNKTQKTSFRMLLRSLIWRCCRWNNKRFDAWIRNFSPDLILFTNGDSFFMLDIARILSTKYQLPLVVFNTEGYYFFKNNYFKNSMGSRLLFPLYRLLYQRSFKKLINQAVFSIYGNSKLKEDYDNVFNKNGIVLYTGSSIDYRVKKNLSNPPVFSYLGNFGYKRYETLIEVSIILHEIDENFKLDVYGDAPDKIKDILDNAPYIEYKGFVSYSQVIDIIHKSDFLFHVENQDPSLQESLKYGFSTKIADSLGSGSLFCLYSSPEIACAKYIRDLGVAIFADNRETLKCQLLELLADNDTRLEMIEQQHKIASRNHSLENSAVVFRNCLSEIAMNK